MSRQISHRKLDHIKIVLQEPDVDRVANYFDGIRLRHRALPEMRLVDVDPSTTFLGKKVTFPLLISSMTGGDHTLLKKINRHLALAAEQTGVAMAVGSQRIAFENPKAVESFQLRHWAPSIPLISNLGAVQLNYGFGVEHCKAAVQMVEADGLYLHLNTLQEAVQPEGNTNFSCLVEKIKKINAALEVPVLIKEVGCGMMADDIERCVQAGIRYIDIAGQGGTSWSRVEAYRDHATFSHCGVQLQDWGIPTPIALQEAAPYMSDACIIASGGIRGALDMIKSMVMGARMCGIASPFLKAAMQSSDCVVREIELLKRAFAVVMFLLGVKNIDELCGNSRLLLTTLD